MTAEALYLGTDDEQVITAAAALNGGDIVALGDGRAGVVQGLGSYAIGDKVKVATKGRFRVLAATGTTFTVGAVVDWDDTNKLAVADGDFNIGRAEFAKASGPLYVDVLLNDRATTT